MNNQKKNLKKAAVVTSALLSGSVIGLSPLNAETGSLFSYNTLGTGAELRSEIINMNESLEASKVAESTSAIRFSELKCGEGKCGEEKKEKKSEGKKEANKSESKSSEATCGGEEKKEKKSEGTKEAKKSESKASESKCGEGKCG